MSFELVWEPWLSTAYDGPSLSLLRSRIVPSLPLSLVFLPAPSLAFSLSTREATSLVFVLPSLVFLPTGLYRVKYNC